MKKGLFVFVAAALMLCIAVPAKADVTVWIGQVDSDDFLIEGATFFGGAAGFNFTPYFGLEVAVDYANDSELPFDLQELADRYGVDVTTELLFISGNLIVQYPLEAFTPFVTVGYGVFGVRLSASDADDVEDELSGDTFITFGAGAKANITDYFAIRGEWKMYRLNSDDPYVIEDLIEIPKNPVFNRFSIGLSLTY